MRSFKNASALSSIAYRFFTGLILSFAIGCNLPQPQSRETENASYTIENKDPKFTVTQPIEGFSLPKSRTLHIESCTKDLKMQKPIINHRFVVSGEQKSVELISDANGCINWDETVGFNFFADAKYIELERTIEAKGLQKGTRTLRLAVNPWESLALDLSKTKVENLVEAKNAVSALQGLAETAPKSILASDLRVSITEKQSTQNGTTLNMEVRANPSVEIKKSSGELTLVPILSGTFQAQIFLIHTVAKGTAEVRTELFKSQPFATQANDGQLSMRLPITLPPNCVRGQYQLGFKLKATPAAGPAASSGIDKLKAFEGVYYLSECEQIKGNFFAVLTSEASQKNRSFSIEKYLKETPELKENTTISSSDTVLPTEGFQKMGYEFSKLSVSDYAYSNRESTKREREFLLKSCVFSGIDGKPLRAQSFSIRKVNGTTEENIRSNNQGCIEWKDSVSFNYFDQECKKPYSVEVTNKDLGIQKTIPLLINPWSSSSNAIEDISTTKMQPRCATGLTELRTNQYEFTKARFNYSVDSFLNLKVQKSGILSLGLDVKRPSLTDPSGFEESPAPYGQYRLKLALLDATTDFSSDLRGKVFMVTEKVITLNAQSTLVDEIMLEAISLKEIGNSTKLWLEVSPLEENDHIRPITFQGSLRFADDTASSNLRELSVESGTSKSMIERAKLAFQLDQTEKAKNLAANSSKQSTARDLNLQLIDLNTKEELHKVSPRLASQKEIIQQWLSQGVMSTQLAQQFCLAWSNDLLRAKGLINSFSMMSSLRQCMIAVEQRPEKYFDIQYRYFVKNPTVPSLQQESVHMQDFAMSNAFNNGMSYVNSHTINDAVDVGFGFSSGKWFGLSASSGYRHSIAWAKQWGSQQATNQSTTGSITLKTEKVALKIQAESLEKCAVIKIRPEIYLDEGSPLRQALPPELSQTQKAKALTEGLMICSGIPSKKPMVFTENYYIMNQYVVGSQVSDASTNLNRPYFIALRGDEDFSQFISLVHAGTSIPDSYLGDFQTKDLLKARYSNLFLKGLPGSPGQFIAPR